MSTYLLRSSPLRDGGRISKSVRYHLLCQKGLQAQRHRLSFDLSFSILPCLARYVHWPRDHRRICVAIPFSILSDSWRCRQVCSFSHILPSPISNTTSFHKHKARSVSHACLRLHTQVGVRAGQQNERSLLGMQATPMLSSRIATSLRLRDLQEDACNNLQRKGSCTLTSVSAIAAIRTYFKVMLMSVHDMCVTSMIHGSSTFVRSLPRLMPHGTSWMGAFRVSPC
jgi:hypothetical protein